jgi:hypothetical protein
MTDETARLRAVARRILAQEIGGRQAPAEVAAAIEAAFAGLYGLMRNLIGHHGFEALVSRAIHLSSEEFAWIETIELRAESRLTLRNLDAVVEAEGLLRARDGAAALMATVIGLLFSFLGADLTMRLLRRSWAIEADEPEQPGRPGEPDDDSNEPGDPSAGAAGAGPKES